MSSMIASRPTIKITKRSSVFDRAIAWVSRASSPDLGGSRGYLRSMLFHRVRDSVRAVATDGYRVHYAELPESYVRDLGVYISPGWGEGDWLAAPLVVRRVGEVRFGPVAGQLRYPQYIRAFQSPVARVSIIDPIHAPWAASDQLLNSVLIALQDAGELIPRLDHEYVRDLSRYDFHPDVLHYTPTLPASSVLEFAYTDASVVIGAVLKPRSRG